MFKAAVVVEAIIMDICLLNTSDIEVSSSTSGVFKDLYFGKHFEKSPFCRLKTTFTCQQVSCPQTHRKMCFYKKPHVRVARPLIPSHFGYAVSSF